MRRFPSAREALAGGALTVALLGVAACRGQLAALGANGLLHPSRRTADVAPPADYKSVRFTGAAVALDGWRVASRTSSRRGTFVYLHGVADSRRSAVGAMERFANRGFDAVAYDSRAHGDSEGAVCTYGFYEKRDLSRVLDQIEAGPIVVMGTSLGAAVALQAAADDRRIGAVIAAESFADLRTVASARAPWFFDNGVVSRAFALAEQMGHFRVDEVSPVEAARRIRVPVFAIHGAADTETPLEHSRLIFNALAAPRQLRIVEGAGHNQSLTPAVWREIDAWIDSILPSGMKS